MKDPILITGAARSGTSMVAGIINICGAYGGNMSGPNRNNAKGMFENANIRNNVVKPYFRSIKADPLGQYPLPDIVKVMNHAVNKNFVSDWRHKVEHTFINEGYVDGPWMYKGAKMALHWPVWHEAFPTAKWVIVRRKTGDIINSCQRTGFMRAFNNQPNQRAVGASNEKEGWLWWVHQHLDSFLDMVHGKLDIQIVWPDRMVDGHYEQIEELIEWLGLEWKEDEVKSFIEPKLWKSKQKIAPIKFKK